ncbi:hypothetical protein [Streptomyces sp.]|uniref:hypothetical protein n=1 Tax=Streptomyces sp. TaxID=1931 RepID=UPI002F95CE1B
MNKHTLARPRLDGTGWAHPYASPFVCYADGGDAGASGSDPGTATPPAGDQGGQQSGQSADQSGQTDTDHTATIARLERDLAAARQEAGKARTTAKANAAEQARLEMAQTIGKALGLVQDDTPPDPAELTRTIGEKASRITELETTARTQAIELAAYKAAAKHGADPGALLDSRNFLTSVTGLDPAADDFTTKLDDAIKTAVENNQQLRTGQAPRRGGGDFNGGPGASTSRPTSLGQAIAAKFGG